ncbi:sigma-54 dependent transcriptional regulator [Desulfobaculum bizertense]|uniref:sigma-54 dependent transcriptional regulator n=1 Tax=Desulfobaculum bizertense TaxID=376490 RepID=UPI001F16DB8F|nr:sigma-54 dependent transcriptional regulator [Desulfobaculum bizertense]UIJ37931.1 sigma-54 dependent transcriptional regulator [Desulfobaculum bizertense]
MLDKTLLFLSKPQSISGLFPEFKKAGITAGLAENLSGALDFIQKNRPCVIFSAPRIAGYRAETLLSQAEQDGSFPPVIIFDERGSADDARHYMSCGAKDYWLEPLIWEKIETVLSLPSEAKAKSQPSPKSTTVSKHSTGVTIIGSHPAMRRTLALAAQVAPSKASVLISGESGTGKEMFARYLHAKSKRADGPFIAINCAALPEHLLESELFGHEKGAFTGAINRKPGKFELAHSGTILLDEITEMDLGLQAKLLRVLQEGEIDRVGGTETLKVDVRVLATTNRDIEESVKNKEFRQDLFFRLNVIPLRLPALRERGDDILRLAQFFAARYTSEYELPAPSFSDDAQKWLLSYDWPGNVRELQNLMERAVLLAGTGPISTKHFLLDPDAWPLPEDALPEEEQEAEHADTPSARADTPLADALQENEMRLQDIERIAILKRLEQTSGNRTQAADLLGISVRTLRNKISEYKKLGLAVP